MMMMNDNKHYMAMFVIMIISGFLTTMNTWSDNIDDVKFSLNDFYMVFLMTGWMFLFMGIYDRKLFIMLIGILLVGFNLASIRTQLGINENQFLLGMIPHHSMAILMSKKLLEKDNLPKDVENLANNIINSQENEIKFMKEKLNQL